MKDGKNKKYTKEELRKMIEEMGGNPDSVSTGAVSRDFASCDIVYRSYLDDNELPIFLGVDNSTSKFYLGFGPDNPFVLKRDEVNYLLAALTGLVIKSQEEQFNKTPQQVQDDVADLKSRVTFGKGINPSGGKVGEGQEIEDHNLEELKNKIFEEPDPEKQAELESKLEELKDSLNETKNLIEQADEFTKNMSEKDKEEYLNKLAEEEQLKLAKKAREFERCLVGTYEEDDEETYNFNYFYNMYKTNLKEHNQAYAQAILKEELAKVPEEERQEIIKKIMQEHQIKQKKDNEKNV